MSTDLRMRGLGLVGKPSSAGFATALVGLMALTLAPMVVVSSEKNVLGFREVSPARLICPRSTVICRARD